MISKTFGRKRHGGLKPKIPSNGSWCYFLVTHVILVGSDVSLLALYILNSYLVTVSEQKIKDFSCRAFKVELTRHPSVVRTTRIAGAC